MAHYGKAFDFDNLPGTWFSTATFIEAQLYRAKDVLLVIDNYVPPNSSHEHRDLRAKALRVLQTIGDRQARGRCNAEAEERPQRRPRTMPICTGEILPPTNESTLGRVVVVNIKNGDVRLDEIRRVRRDIDKLGQAMHGFIRYLASRNIDARARVAFNREHSILPDLSDAHQRVPTSLAMLLTGFEMFVGFARSINAVTDEEGVSLMNRCVQALLALGTTQPRNEAPTAVEEYIAAVRSLLVSGRAKLSPVTSGVLSHELGGDRLGDENRGVHRAGYRLRDGGRVQADHRLAAQPDGRAPTAPSCRS